VWDRISKIASHEICDCGAKETSVAKQSEWRNIGRSECDGLPAQAEERRGNRSISWINPVRDGDGSCHAWQKPRRDGLVRLRSLVTKYSGGHFDAHGSRYCRGWRGRERDQGCQRSARAVGQDIDEVGDQGGCIDSGAICEGARAVRRSGRAGLEQNREGWWRVDIPGAEERCSLKGGCGGSDTTVLAVGRC